MQQWCATDAAEHCVPLPCSCCKQLLLLKSCVGAVFACNVEWQYFPVQELDLSDNQLQGSILSYWTSGSKLSTSLETLRLERNQLAGVLPSMNMPALSCWSVFGNWQMCGAQPTSGVCGNLNSTWLGECLVGSPLGQQRWKHPAALSTGSQIMWHQMKWQCFEG